MNPPAVTFGNSVDMNCLSQLRFWLGNVNILGTAYPAFPNSDPTFHFHSQHALFHKRAFGTGWSSERGLWNSAFEYPPPKTGNMCFLNILSLTSTAAWRDLVGSERRTHAFKFDDHIHLKAHTALAGGCLIVTWTFSPHRSLISHASTVLWHLLIAG